MQLCEAELAAVNGDTRKKVIGECLRRRLEGEKIVERDCKRQAREVVVELSANTKQDMHRQCMRSALQVSYTELPRRPVAAPKTEGGAVMVATDGTDTPAGTGAPNPTPSATPAAAPAQSAAIAVRQ
jgi:hypothetical protein